MDNWTYTQKTPKSPCKAYCRFKCSRDHGKSKPLNTLSEVVGTNMMYFGLIESMVGKKILSGQANIQIDRIRLR